MHIEASVILPSIQSSLLFCIAFQFALTFQIGSQLWIFRFHWHQSPEFMLRRLDFCIQPLFYTLCMFLVGAFSVDQPIKAARPRKAGFLLVCHTGRAFRTRQDDKCTIGSHVHTATKAVPCCNLPERASEGPLS